VDRLTVYEKPTCTTCRNLATLLAERGIDFETVNYHVEGIPEPRLRELLTKAGLSARDVLRTKEPLVSELHLDDPGVGEDQLIAAMVEHPVLVQRPIVEKGDRAVLARPVEKALELLD
jgi:arsenate reductase (glutaredoxin)